MAVEHHEAPGETKTPFTGGHMPTADSTVVLGRRLPFPVYTVVFIGLGILTISELVVAEFLPRGGLTIPLLLALTIAKAGLVVWFYMHLNTDSRIFAITLLIPVAMVILATLFLMMVPVGY